MLVERCKSAYVLLQQAAGPPPPYTDDSPLYTGEDENMKLPAYSEGPPPYDHGVRVRVLHTCHCGYASGVQTQSESLLTLLQQPSTIADVFRYRSFVPTSDRV